MKQISEANDVEKHNKSMMGKIISEFRISFLDYLLNH